MIRDARSLRALSKHRVHGAHGPRYSDRKTTQSRATMDDDDRAPPHEGRDGSSHSGEIGVAKAIGGGDYGDGVPSGGEGPIALKGVFLGNL
jgi:hypothetical protein